MNKKFYTRIALIFIVSFLIQIVLISFFKTPLDKDALYYDTVANKILEGKGFSDDGVIPAINVKPAYVLFLASIYKIFGHNPQVVKIFQAIFVSFTCIVVFLIGRELFNDKIGYISGLVAALYPPIFVISNCVISESLFTLVLSLVILFLVLGQKYNSKKLYIYAALLLGLSTQIRSTSVFFPFFIPLGFMGIKRGFRKSLFPLLVSITMVLLFLAPMAIRNFVHFGLFRPLEGVGMIWVGSFVEGDATQDNPLTTEMIHSIREKEKESITDQHMSKVIIEDAYIRRGIASILNNPLGYIRLFPKKIFRLWIGSYSGLFNIGIPFKSFVYDFKLIREHPFILLWKSFILILSCLVFAGSLTGMTIANKKTPGVMLLIAVILYFTLFHMLIYASTRLGIPALPYMIIFAVVTMEKLLSKYRRTNSEIPNI